MGQINQFKNYLYLKGIRKTMGKLFLFGRNYGHYRCVQKISQEKTTEKI